MTTETQQTAPSDPWAAADAAKPGGRARHYFGYVAVDAWNAVLVKGTGKVVFDPQAHSPEQRVTALTITVTPLPRAGRNEYQISRDLIAESSDWTRTVKPSLDKLAVNLKSTHGKYAQIELVEVGNYTNKAGEAKTRTMPRFLAIYQTEAECQAASDAYWAGASTPQATPAQPAQPAQASDAEKMMAARFLPALLNSSKAGDPNHVVDRFLAAVAGNSLTARYFNASSPEVIAILMATEQHA